MQLIFFLGFINAGQFLPSGALGSVRPPRSTYVYT